MKRLIFVMAVISLCFFGTSAFALVGIDNYTVLMPHFNGDDGSINFVDDSFGGHIATAHGNVQIDIAQSKFGGASGFFDGSGDYLSLADTNDWVFGNSDFTIDFWARFASVPSYVLGETVPFFHQYLVGNIDENHGIFWLDAGSNSLQFIYRDDGAMKVHHSYGWSPSINTWYHIAYARNGDNSLIFVDGILVASGTNWAGDNYVNFNSNLLIGGDPSGYGYLNGWLDEIRVSKGIARWTSDFTPPTSEYTVAPEPIPEPSSIILLTLGFLGAGIFKKRFRA